jgi:hypothetical protein
MSVYFMIQSTIPKRQQHDKNKEPNASSIVFDAEKTAQDPNQTKCLKPLPSPQSHSHDN